MTHTTAGNKPGIALAPLLAAGLIAAVVGWSFWPTFQGLYHKWMNDAGYSHGLLVPMFSAYLLWVRRDRLRVGEPLIGPGLALLLIAVALRGIGGVFAFFWFDSIAILPALLGAVLIIGGRPALRATWPAILFLFFMIPLPYKLETMLGGPLQTLASRGSTFLLQALGQPAVREGNTIMLNEIKLGIVEACSGLRMLVTFFCFSTGVAILMRKPMLEKICVVLSAVPIALLTNILRITATGIMYTVNAQFAHAFFHDFAGWFMMPICLALLGLELWVLNRLIIDTTPIGPRPAMLLR